MSVNTENLEKAIKAALEGPEERGLRIADYRFNIKPAKISRNGNTVSVVGREDHYISRRRRGRRNDRIFYEFAKSGEEIQALVIEIDRRGIKAILSRPLADIKKTIEKATEILINVWQPDRRKAGDSRLKAYPVALTAATGELQHLLDGSWEGEAAFLVGSIVLRA